MAETFKKTIPWLIVCILILLAGYLFSKPGSEDWIWQSIAVAAGLFFVVLSLAPDYPDPTASLRFHGSALFACGAISIATTMLHQPAGLGTSLIFYGGVLAVVIGLVVNLIVIMNNKNRATVLSCIGMFGTVMGYAVSLWIGAL